MEAARQGEAELLCVGGELRKINGALVGGQALEIFATVRADFAFIGASGLEAEEGCSNTQLFEARDDEGDPRESDTKDPAGGRHKMAASDHHPLRGAK